MTGFPSPMASKVKYRRPGFKVTLAPWYPTWVNTWHFVAFSSKVIECTPLGKVSFRSGKSWEFPFISYNKHHLINSIILNRAVLLIVKEICFSRTLWGRDDCDEASWSGGCTTRIDKWGFPSLYDLYLLLCSGNYEKGFCIVVIGFFPILFGTEKSETTLVQKKVNNERTPIEFK